MNLPYPPTDNLYKFMAIAGVLIFLLSWWPIYLFYGIGQQSIALRSEVDVMEIETQYVEMFVEGVRTELSLERLPGDDTAPGETGSQQRERPADRVERRRTLTEEALARNRDLQIKTRQLSAKLESLDHLQRAHAVLRVLSLIGISVSIALAYVGFKFWYTRVQKHLDHEYQARGQIKPKRVARGRKGVGK